MGQYISEWPNSLFPSLPIFLSLSCSFFLPPPSPIYISDEHINCSFMPWTKQFPKQTEEVSSHFYNNFIYFIFLFLIAYLCYVFLLLISISEYINGKKLQDKEDLYFSLMCFGQPLRSLERKEDNSYSQKIFIQRKQLSLITTEFYTSAQAEWTLQCNSLIYKKDMQMLLQRILRLFFLRS